MNTEKVCRIVTIGKQILDILTDEEREVYECKDDALSFVEDVINMLKIDFPWTDVDLIDYIHDKIFDDKL